MVNIGNGLPYIPSGFRLDGSIEEGDLIYVLQDAITTKIGDAIFATATGCTNVGTQFASTFLGVAAAAQVVTVAGVTFLPIIKPNPNKFFWVPVGSAAVATQAAVGTLVDLKANNSVDLTDTTNTIWLFQISDFDVSTLAVAANAAGFVKGSFQHQ